jgi:hypothetical protein
LFALFYGLAACATGPEQSRTMTVAWHEVSMPILQKVCQDDSDALRGCYRMSMSGECLIYTLPFWTYEQRNQERSFEQTAGHELRHCRDGRFHGEWICTSSGCRTALR